MEPLKSLTDPRVVLPVRGRVSNYRRDGARRSRRTLRAMRSPKRTVMNAASSCSSGVDRTGCAPAQPNKTTACLRAGRFHSESGLRWGHSRIDFVQSPATCIIRERAAGARSGGERTSRLPRVEARNCAGTGVFGGSVVASAEHECRPALRPEIARGTVRHHRVRHIHPALGSRWRG